MAGRFENKVVVITGAAGGIGRATAMRFASEGARIVAVDLEDSELNQTKETVERAGGEVAVQSADVTVAADVERYVTTALERFGQIDVFFNNAGIEGWIGSLLDYPEEVFDRVFAVNVKGVWLGVKYVAPVMREAGGGVIINTASVAGLSGTPGAVAYGASKHAVVGITKSAALELAPDQIRVNAVCPGWVNTDMAREGVEGMAQGMGVSVEEARAIAMSEVPMGRMSEPKDIAGFVSWLISADARGVTGQALDMNGGAFMS